MTAPSQFYTGLVAELYASLRSADPDVETCARFVTRNGTPALELGCGDGDPLRTAMTTGALYTAILFFLGDRAVVRNGVLGVSLSYIAETSFGKDNAKEADDSDDERRGGDDHIA